MGKDYIVLYAMYMTVGNIPLKKRECHLITNYSGLLNTLKDYRFVRSDQSQFVKDTKVLSGEECAI